MFQLAPGGLVEVGGKLRECGQFPVLRQRQLDAAGDLLHERHLGCAAHPGDGDTGAHGGPQAGIEVICFQENLAVGDGDDIGRHEGGNIAGLGFDDGQGGERPGLVLDAPVGNLLHILGIDPRGPLQQARVQVENIARIRLAARRTPQQQRDLPVRPGLLGQVVVDNQRILALVAEELAHRAPGIGRDELHRRRVGGACGHDDGVIHDAMLFEGAHDVGDGGHLLADGDVNTLDAAVSLVDDGVHGDGGLADLPVADDEFPLPAANGNHGVDTLEAGLHGLADRLTGNDARCHLLDRCRGRRLDRASAIDRIA